MRSPPPLEICANVATALKAGRPVVALSSAPIAHTFPRPANLETVRLADDAARAEGATLAVVAVWEGRLTVGLSDAELQALAHAEGVLRASRRDLAGAIVAGRTAATTVSASMYLAHRAGIRVLATGAIGGAARDGTSIDKHVWDVSADLVELSHTPVAVVSAGARSVHNVAYTAEVLETFRVPVVGYQTDYFPIFYMRAGSQPVCTRANTPAEVAAVLNAHWGMEGTGVVVAQPTPAEAALSPDDLLPALQVVEEQAVQDGIAGKDLSPFLMDRLNRLTRGKALRAYQAAIVANVRLAAQIAQALRDE